MTVTFKRGDEIVLKVGDKLLACVVCDRYQNKEGTWILHLVEPETQSQFRRYESIFQKEEKIARIAEGGAH